MNNIFLKILQEERQQLLQKLATIDQAIEMYKVTTEANENGLRQNIYINVNAILNSTDNGFFHKYSQYISEWPTKDKILFIIKTENRFLHVREIARIMHLLEEGETMQQAIKKISPALSFLKKGTGAKLVSVEAGGLHFNTFWGYRDWINLDGEIPTAFMYNESEITKRKRQVSA